MLYNDSAEYLHWTFLFAQVELLPIFFNGTFGNIFKWSFCQYFYIKPLAIFFNGTFDNIFTGIF
jgi:hypothetical protein